MRRANLSAGVIGGGHDGLVLVCASLVSYQPDTVAELAGIADSLFSLLEQAMIVTAITKVVVSDT